MAPQVLLRISVRWFPEPAFEDTETIALNVGGYFLDLRVVSKDKSLQWSRAGERKVVKEEPFTYQWSRIIDSTNTHEPDEATWDWEKLKNGDAYEAGTAHCPLKNGALTPYEEIWRDITRAGPTADSWILQSTKASTATSNEGPDCEDGTVFLGCIGGTFLGMRSRKGEGFAVRRNDWDAGKKSWRITFETGDVEGIPEIDHVIDILPTLAGSRAVGTKVALRGVEYVVKASE